MNLNIHFTIGHCFLWTRQQQLIMSFNGCKLQDIESTLFEYFRSKIIFTNHIFPHDINNSRSVRAASTIQLSLFSGEWGEGHCCLSALWLHNTVPQKVQRTAATVDTKAFNLFRNLVDMQTSGVEIWLICKTSGVGGGGAGDARSAGDASAPPKVLIWLKFGENPWKSRQKFLQNPWKPGQTPRNHTQKLRFFAESYNVCRIIWRSFLEVIPKQGLHEKIFAEKVVKNVFEQVWGNLGKHSPHPQKSKTIACSYTYDANVWRGKHLTKCKSLDDWCRRRVCPFDLVKILEKSHKIRAKFSKLPGKSLRTF